MKGEVEVHSLKDEASLRQLQMKPFRTVVLENNINK
jgi:hypothetical protein